VQNFRVKKIVSFIFCCFLILNCVAQSGNDSIRPVQDSAALQQPKQNPIKKDSATKPKKIRDTSIANPPDSIQNPDSAVIPPPDQRLIESLRTFMNALMDHPYFSFFGKADKLTVEEKAVVNRDLMFYALIGILIYFALIRVFFWKYLSNLTYLFFRVTMRQQQIREQLLQTPLPSMLLNVLFIISGGLYLAFLSEYYRFGSVGSIWLLWLYCSIFLSVVYISKFFLLKFAGWIFGVSAASDTYIFIVFLVNKMVGIFLLPVLVILAFPHPDFQSLAITLSFIMLVVLFFYRFFISYRPVRSEIKINRFHFFIYLCAFEVAPLLLIYKVLLNLVERGN
jgi:uncharacterized protein DUF4271